MQLLRTLKDEDPERVSLETIGRTYEDREMLMAKISVGKRPL